MSETTFEGLAFVPAEGGFRIVKNGELLCSSPELFTGCSIVDDDEICALVSLNTI